jgi:hypothetical protein
MDAIIPRYEFRIFSENLSKIKNRLNQISSVENIRKSSEVYIISPATTKSNVKIRNEQIDIKVLINEEHGLEQWLPQLKVDFPIRQNIIQQKIFPFLKTKTPNFELKEYSQEQFLNELVEPNEILRMVEVKKSRYAYNVNGCISEFAKLKINQIPIQTVSVESDHYDSVLVALSVLGIEHYENENYIKAIKRLIGIYA